MNAKRIDAVGSVYKLVGHNGECLYVGQTKLHPEIRLYEHRHRQPWAAEISHVEVLAAEIATEVERRVVEIEFTQRLQPKHGGRFARRQPMTTTVWYFFFHLSQMSGWA